MNFRRSNAFHEFKFVLNENIVFDLTIGTLGDEEVDDEDASVVCRTLFDDEDAFAVGC